MNQSRRRELVYAGVVRHEGELVHAYYMVKDDGALSEQAEIYPHALGDFPPGAVCSYLIGRNGSVHTNSTTFERTWPDTKLVSEWLARHDVTTASEAAWSSKQLPGAFACMDPMRDAYRTLKDPELQGLLIAQMTRYIVSPK